MSKIKVLAGDFIVGVGEFSWDRIKLPTKDSLDGEYIYATELESVELVTDEYVKKIFQMICWGIVGGILLSGEGLLAGLLLGGWKKEITFAARFKDGRKLMATTNNKTFAELKAECF